MTIATNTLSSQGSSISTEASVKSSDQKKDANVDVVPPNSCQAEQGKINIVNKVDSSRVSSNKQSLQRLTSELMTRQSVITI